jgi:hypothetical protein
VIVASASVLRAGAKSGQHAVVPSSVAATKATSVAGATATASHQLVSTRKGPLCDAGVQRAAEFKATQPDRDNAED